ncbi:MAG: acyl-CoA thioesterase [Planctomycetales bacterium]|nr:acyl-CoA thioesterase [Planctomycetales bacterium]
MNHGPHDRQSAHDEAVDCDLQQQLSAYASVLELPVQWGEQDANGHVNHGSPVRWLESARLHYIRENGVHAALRAAELSPIIAEIRVQYRRQITYPDNVLIGCRIIDLGRSSMVIEQGVFSRRDGALAIEAEVKVVMLDVTAQRPRRIPAEVAEAFARELR